MAQRDFAAKGQFIGLVAMEAAEESDAIERHPQVIDVLTDLADEPGLRDAFGANGHDPAAFVTALAEGLAPYRREPLDEAPELVEGLAFIAGTIREAVDGDHAATDAGPVTV